jgi:AcrR family transcriptional regulator
MNEETVGLSGRRAQAARNNTLILDAARAVFIADPDAPISAVAERAGVGISALYRRYESKEELLRHLAGEALQRYIAAVEKALDSDDDPWELFAEFLRDVVDADTHSLTLALAGTFESTEELDRAAEYAHELNMRLFDRTSAAGEIRPGLDVNDLSFIFEQLAAIRGGGEQRTRELRQRYLALLLDAIHNPEGSPLPGSPPTWAEISERWEVPQ